MKKFISNIFLATALVGGVCSCNDYLDVMPDKRAELNSLEKVKELLVFAYPSSYPMQMYEQRSDNTVDCGAEWGTMSEMLQENYYWKPVTGIYQDTPQYVWEQCYKAVASANQALEAIKEMGGGEKFDAATGEAKLCRAYSMFILANTFCAPYVPSTAESKMGIPYRTTPETVIGEKYERGTLANVYKLIEQDITEGFELIDDGSYAVPLYHFNKRAAAAFAARFFLFKREYEKAIKYANLALPPKDPTSVLRDMYAISELPGYRDQRDAFVAKSEPSNLMLVDMSSWYGRNFVNYRAGHSNYLATEVTYRSSGPYGKLKGFDRLWGSRAPVKWTQRYNEFFEYTDKAAGTGFAHVVNQPFTTDETLLVRAEAKVMLKQYEEAATDLSYWYVSKRGEAATSQEIINWYKERKEKDDESVKKGELNPWETMVKDFNVDYEMDNDQAMMLNAVLQAKRIETLYGGMRWLDIRRYGIVVIHNLDQENPMILTPDDPRRTIQIPTSVIAAGMEKNPEQ